ncbi:2'-5' RNA ligase [Rhodanobacter panaciterrae]|uniref:RNA 2',3'-cyclic phosphodiesterase n=2 Tax=Rhodanobacter panaciterrae TaxID=490572 RepID=A0ABQ2ZNE7_9GAMM|nr:2'-5' RNA ligase [Rhodanobacter panaciterrae]
MVTRKSPTDIPQLDLLGDAYARPAEVHRLFLALIPDESVRARLAAAADTLKIQCPELRARWVNPARYHATLHFLGDHSMLQPDIVAAAKAAADSIRMAPFEWTLDHAAGFHGRQPPCVLRSSLVPEPLQRLWQDLRRALLLAGQGGHLERTFTPHVTLAYSHAVLLQSTAIGPVMWQVDQLALVHRVTGRSNHEVLACWPLWRA